VGRRLAFDAAKGRLWVICPSCERWNLSPIEERWEAVEGCERLFRGQKLRAQTENVGLARLAEGTELIRIGSPLRPEFAAWRYGGVFRRRFRKQIGAAVVSGTCAATGVMMLAGMSIGTALAPIVLVPLLIGGATIGYATVASQFAVVGKVTGASGELLRVTMWNLEHSKFIANYDGSLQLDLTHSGGRQELTGDRATRALGTLLARLNQAGGAKETITAAADLIADAGDPRSAIALIAREAERRTSPVRRVHTLVGDYLTTNRGALHRLPATHRLALEMSLHETSEQFALDQELASLERAWREAEEIAAIADGILTPLLRKH